jgi:hypothetical protein
VINIDACIGSLEAFPIHEEDGSDDRGGREEQRLLA